MKVIFTKLAEQFKQHLINNDQNRQETEQRLSVLEQNQEVASYLTIHQANPERFPNHLGRAAGAFTNAHRRGEE